MEKRDARKLCKQNIKAPVKEGKRKKTKRAREKRKRYKKSSDKKHKKRT